MPLDSSGPTCVGSSKLIEGTDILDVRSPAEPGRVLPNDPPDVQRSKIQAFIDRGMNDNMVVYFPPGTYTVGVGPDDTLSTGVALRCKQSTASGGESQGRMHPCTLVGSTCDQTKKAIIQLDPNAPKGTTLLDVYALGAGENDCGKGQDNCRKFNEN